MRVLWIFEHLHEQPMLQQVAHRLVQQHGVDLEVMCPWRDEPPLDDAVIPLTRLHCRHKIDFAARRGIRAQLAQGDYDIAHAYSSRDLANLLAARHVANRPQLVGYRGTVNRLQRFDPGHWITFWHPALDKIICVCEATRQSLIDSRIDAKKVHTVWEGCDVDVLETPPRSALAQFDIPADAFVVGTVANMRPVKGADLLLQAASQLAERDDIYWLLVGDVRDSRIHELAADPRIADRVRLTGSLPRGGRFSGLMDIYVAPSRMEGLSMGIMEAMSQRVCPLVTNVGGSPELVRHDVDGVVVDAEQPALIAQAIEALYVDPQRRRRLADSASQRIQEEFSIGRWTERLHRFYSKSVLNERSEGPSPTGVRTRFVRQERQTA